MVTPAGVMIFERPSPTGLEVLFGRRAILKQDGSLMSYPGEWDFPGGSSEPEDEDTLRTAVRESSEETGVARCHIYPGRYFCSTTSRQQERRFVVDYFTGRLASSAQPRTNGEFTEFLWMQPCTALRLTTSSGFEEQQRRDFYTFVDPSVPYSRQFPHQFIGVLRKLDLYARSSHSR